MNQPLADRQTAFAAGEYDVARRWRAFAGVESYETNLDGTVAAPGRPSANSGTRGFGGVRFQTGARSTVAFRFEDGDRRARLVAGGRSLVSDSGVLGGDWQTTIGEVNTFARYSRRENVEPLNADASFTQHDLFAHVVWNASRELQIFGTAGGTETMTDAGGGSTYWQLGAGGQMQMRGRSLWLRGEGTVSRHLDLLTQHLVPQESLNVGLNGEIAYRTTLGFNVYADRVTNTTSGQDSWAARSMLRLTRSFATGSPRVPGNGSSLSFARARGTGAVVGLVFKDWNGNGVRDADDEPLEGIPVRLADGGTANTSRQGGFTFANVPVGLVAVGLDLSALPVDFDPPLVSEVHVDLPRGETREVTFGLIPLGAVHGRVVRDLNANGSADPGEPSIDGAVVVLDDGARSEQVRKGQFRFESVRAGTHSIELLIDSLPAGGEIVGERPESIDVSRARLDAEAAFLVVVRPRAEVRTIFPAAGTRPERTPPATVPTITASSTASATRDTAKQSPTAGAVTRMVPPQVASHDRYVIQVAALSDPLRARALVLELQTAGFAAYLVEPPRTDPEAPYRIRIGPFASREAAQRIADTLQKRRGEKLWVTRDVSER
jgi:cell division septation protein DedD